MSQHVTVSPEAIDQRMHTRALAFLQELIRPALAKLQSCQDVYEENLLTPFARVHLADSTGFELPESLKHPFPGSGGSVAQAGAKLPLAWDYNSRGFHHFALTPWNMPDQQDIDTVVTLARHDDLFIVDLGYVKINALARIAAAPADFLCRLNHQTTILAAVADRVAPVALAPCLATVESPIVQKPSLLGVNERVASRLIASRVPVAVVKARRRMARKNAKKTGYTPSQAHLAFLAWNLLITNVPPTIWPPQTGLRVYPLRWQVELIFQSWKRSRHLATLKTTKQHTTLCYLYGRMLLMLLNDALCPQRRATRWLKRRRALSLLKLVRHFQALAERWMQALLQSEIELRRFRQRACATAERLVLKASRKRGTTAQRLRERLTKQNAALVCVEAVNASLHAHAPGGALRPT